MSLEREELDELAAGARDIARITRTQFEAFVESGFSEAQALRLTIAWLVQQLGGAES